MSKGQNDKSVVGSPTVAEVEDATEFIRREKAKYAKVPDETMPQPSGVEKDVLLPCPFCGGSAACFKVDQWHGQVRHNYWVVSCGKYSEDGGCGANVYYSSEIDARRAWNRRATKERTP